MLSYAGWEDGDLVEQDDADTSAFVSAKDKKGPKKIGIKLYFELCKQVMLALRNKKTGSEHVRDFAEFRR